MQGSEKWYDLTSIFNISLGRTDCREARGKAGRASAINWEKDDGVSDQSGNSEGDEKWSDSENM